MKVVVANSVGIDYRNYKMIHSPSRWTNSTEDKNFFTYYPWELAYCSSLLKRDTSADVKFIDGCLEKYNHKKYLQRLCEEKPDYLVMESSTRTINEDLRLALCLKKKIGTKLIMCGQHPTVFPEQVLKGQIQIRPGEDISEFDTTVDFVCLGEYEYTVRDIVSGKSPGDIDGLYPNNRRCLIDINDLPFPEDIDVQRIEYAYPPEPSCEYVEVQAYASRGCPVQCSFCVCGNLYYEKPNWRFRKVNNVIKEIKYLKKKYPQMEGIFFDEEVHSGSKKYVLQLTDAIRKNELDNLHYNAMCGYWNMDQEMLEAFKSAGYYLLRVGIETASEKIAKAMNLKNKFNINKLLKVLEIAKKIGIDMYGTFTFGGPGSTEQEDEKTLDLIYKLMSEGLLHKMQWSINTPQPGTPFYEWADKKGFIISKQWDDYDGGNNVVVEYPYYKYTDIKKQFARASKKFDLGMKTYLSSQIENNLNELLCKLPKLNKILVIRSSRTWHFNKVIDFFKHKYPDCLIYILASKKFKSELNNNEKLFKIIYNNNDFFDIFKLNQKILDMMLTERFDAAFGLYTDFAGTGYSHINDIISKILTANKLTINCAGESFMIKPVTKVNRSTG